MKKLWRFWSG